MSAHHDPRKKELEAIERRVSKKTEFFLSASHQLKSPVAIIQWCLQSVAEMEIDPKAKDLSQKALTQANAMSQLITDMLHVFKLQDRHGKSHDYLPVNVNILVDEIIKQSEVSARRRHIHVVRGPLEIVPMVLVDEAYLRQAVINLLDNAVKYSPEKSTVEVTISLARDKHVEIAFKDQGMGISESEQSHLFTEFFRSLEAQKYTHEGTGLGLVIVRNIIEEFGGTVIVESEVGVGSTFTIRLPV
jgi:two-component system phosphate regulon sensor histidine kinase PhoR